MMIGSQHEMLTGVPAALQLASCSRLQGGLWQHATDERAVFFLKTLTCMFS